MLRLPPRPRELARTPSPRPADGGHRGGRPARLARRRQPDVPGLPAGCAGTGDVRRELRRCAGSGLGILRDSSTRTPGLRRRVGHRRPRPRDGQVADHPGVRRLGRRPAECRRSASPSGSSPPTAGSGEHRFLGILDARALNADVSTTPVLRRMVAAVLAALGATPASYTGQQSLDLLSGYPRAELFWAETDFVVDLVASVLQLASRRRLRAFLQPDPYHRFVTVMVFLPRDRYTTDSRLAMQQVLLDALGGTDIRYTARVGDSLLAAVHFTVRTDPDHPVDVDLLGADRKPARDDPDLGGPAGLGRRRRRRPTRHRRRDEPVRRRLRRGLQGALQPARTRSPTCAFWTGSASPTTWP